MMSLYVQGGPKKRGHSVIVSNFGNTAQIYTIVAEMKVVSFLTRRRNFLKLIMYNNGAIWRIRVTISNDARQ